MEEQLEVTVISNEMVKPSRPTSPELKTRTLSFLDESFPAIHVPSLTIYTGTHLTKPPIDINSPIITSLRTSLSETLTQFYPLAGRFVNEYTVSCDDQGIPFIVTLVKGYLKDYLDSPRKLDLGVKLFPPLDIVSFGQKPITSVVPLVYQVNFFECGGVVIGSYGIHKLIDAISALNIYKYWAAQASGRSNSLLKPDFDSIIKIFPPLPKETREKLNSSQTNPSGGPNDATGAVSIGLSHHLKLPIKVVAKGFKFTFEAINKLKVEAISETVPRPSTFGALTGFVWKCVMEAVLNNNNDDNTPDELRQPIPKAISFGASLRSRIKPPLSLQSMGNMIVSLRASIDYDEEGSLENLKLEKIVRLIHATVTTVDDKLEALQAEDGGERFLAERKAEFSASSSKDKTPALVAFNWSRLGFDELDFGFGLPAHVIPVGIVYPFLRNTVMLLDYSDGIEVYVCLEEKEMSFLEANSKFMAFTSS